MYHLLKNSRVTQILLNLYSKSVATVECQERWASCQEPWASRFCLPYGMSRRDLSKNSTILNMYKVTVSYTFVHLSTLWFMYMLRVFAQVQRFIFACTNRCTSRTN